MDRPRPGDRDSSGAVVTRRTALKFVGAVGLAGVATGARAQSSDAPYSVAQGDRDVPVVPLSGGDPVEELYGLQLPGRFGGDNGASDRGGPYYQSNGTSDLQREDVTVSFLYDGPNGHSLVVVHDSTASTDGGAVTWTVRDVPGDAAWAVKDDYYTDPETGEPAGNNFDRWDVDGTTHTVDWTWGSAGTDGGVLRSPGGRLDVTVEPAFNEAATLWGEHYAEDPVSDWQFLSFPDGRDSPERTSLALDEPVSVAPTDRGQSDGDDGSDDEDESESDDRSEKPDYPSHSGTHTITDEDNYWAWEFSVSETVLLSYTAENEREEKYDFDVLLYPPEEFEEYHLLATDQKEWIRPPYQDGSAPGVRSRAERETELSSGTYYLVIDNTDLSDAGDWGREATREVRLEATVEPV